MIDPPFLTNLYTMDPEKELLINRLNVPALRMAVLRHQHDTKGVVSMKRSQLIKRIRDSVCPTAAQLQTALEEQEAQSSSKKAREARALKAYEAKGMSFKVNDRVVWKDRDGHHYFGTIRKIEAYEGGKAFISRAGSETTPLSGINEGWMSVKPNWDTIVKCGQVERSFWSMMLYNPSGVYDERA